VSKACSSGVVVRENGAFGLCGAGNSVIMVLPKEGSAMTNFDPTVRRQELGEELRVLRKAANYTLEQAGHVIGSSASKVSRMETGHRTASPIDVSALLALYRASLKKRNEVLALAQAADEVGWWQRNQSDFAEQRDTLLTLEAKAESIVNFGLSLVPGLLQTGEYTRSVMSTCDYVPETDIENRMFTRVRRQSILMRRNPPSVLALVDELALRRLVGNREIQRRQFAYLLEQSRDPRLSLRVVPNDGQVHGGVEGSFVILRRRGFPTVAFTETMTSSLFFEDPKEVETYESVVLGLLGRALCKEESVEFVAWLAKQLDTEVHPWTPGLQTN
jgi:transcriptional regulator with XRE-family HTH domain